MRRERPKGVVRRTEAKRSLKQPDPSGGNIKGKGNAKKYSVESQLKHDPTPYFKKVEFYLLPINNNNPILHNNLKDIFIQYLPDGT